MKLIQFNIWQGRILRHVTHLFEAEQPDIVCLQEVLSAQEQVPHWDTFSALQDIQQALPGYHTFFAPVYSGSMVGRRFDFGNAILSRYPISDQQVQFVCGEYIDDIAITEPGNTRNLQTCTVELPEGKKLSILNHHAYWDRNPMGVPESVEKMKLVKQAADALPHPLIVSGDMNVLPESKAMQVFEGSLTNLTKKYALPTTLTQVAKAIDNGNQVSCDHVLVSDEIQVQQFVASDYIASDHKALILTFDC